MNGVTMQLGMTQRMKSIEEQKYGRRLSLFLLGSPVRSDYGTRAMIAGFREMKKS